MGAVARENVVFEQVVEIAYVYLGPAARRFIIREIEANLGKKPDKLTRADIPKLNDWCKLAIALLTEDNKIVDEFSAHMLAIARKGK